MHLTPITAIIVLILVTSLVLGGAIDTLRIGNNQTRNVSTAYPSGRSGLLQGIEASFNESAAYNEYENYTVTWLDNATIIVHLRITSETEVITDHYKFTQFPTVEGASEYFDGHELEYTSSSDTIDHAPLYAHVTGVMHPSVSQEVILPGNTTFYLEQINSLIITGSSSRLPLVNATGAAAPTRSTAALPSATNAHHMTWKLKVRTIQILSNSLMASARASTAQRTTTVP